jgi:hypothetical protein
MGAPRHLALKSGVGPSLFIENFVREANEIIRSARITRPLSGLSQSEKTV